MGLNDDQVTNIGTYYVDKTNGDAPVKPPTLIFVRCIENFPELLGKLFEIMVVENFVRKSHRQTE